MLLRHDPMFGLSLCNQNQDYMPILDDEGKFAITAKPEEKTTGNLLQLIDLVPNSNLIKLYTSPDRLQVTSRVQ